MADLKSLLGTTIAIYNNRGIIEQKAVVHPLTHAQRYISRAKKIHVCSSVKRHLFNPMGGSGTLLKLYRQVPKK
jgi:hypothetical protein